MLIRNKKGNIQDVLWIMAVIFAFAVVILIIYYVWAQINPSIDSALTNVGNETAFNVTKMYSQQTTALGTFDNVMPLILIGLIMGTLVSAFFIQSHPVIFFIFLVPLIIFLVVGAIFANVYQDITETSAFVTTAAEFNVTEKIMRNLPFIALIMFAVVVLILVMKPQSQNLAGGY